MNRLHIALNDLPDELRPGVELLREDYPIGADAAADARTARFERGDSGAIDVATRDGVTTVRYAEKVHAFRAIGRLLGGSEGVDAPVAYSEAPAMDFIGLMLDNSRNAVHTPENVRRWLRRLALMGVNAVCLYTEDTYEVPGEPFFGYGRGPYTHAEAVGLDDYADDLGIEMFPCIQTLAHLQQALQWPVYKEITDLDGILLADDPKTYEFLERIIDAATKPFRSKRIHLGMDEAHGLGTGRYAEIYGERRRFDIMVNHLDRVLDITRKLDLKPMMWSDMWFRIGSKQDDYYDPETVIPDDVIETIPKDVTQVYWDYYHRDADFYRDWIARHRALGGEPLVAPGAWTWNRFWAYYLHAFETMNPCMEVCREQGVREVLMTMWGDDGSECDFMAGLPVMARFAEYAYRDTPDDDNVRAVFHGATGSEFGSWIAAGDIDAVSILDDPGEFHPNPSKWLLFEDPLIGLCQPQLDGRSLADEYAKLADRLDAAADDGGMMDSHLAFPAQIARVLALKADLPSRLRAAYTERDLDELRATTESLPALLIEVRKLRNIHRSLWFEQHKPQGWEVIEGRYGRLMLRIETALWRLDQYLSGEIANLPELEEEHHKVYDNGPGHLPDLKYRGIYTASALK